MIQYNFATELCMTRCQEGYVHGWQSRMGKKNQLVLDTLFIKIKQPPSEVQFEGLPPNVVPIYPTTNNIYASLPNDDRILITRTQVETLVNFAMTDFGSQGKTRPYNVSDLNKLQTHQSYYTALSRSASAEGTLILQGFDSRKFTGKCSGALRQEFRELEILDEITRLRYEGKLSIKVYGEIRNTLIKTFREWKGQQYVPNIVHSAIRWSKRDPLFESEIIDIKIITSFMNTGNKNKRKIDDNVSSKSTIFQNISKNVELNSKKLCLFQPSSDDSNHYLIPQGMIWSNNSCAYDSIFTILFSIWCDNKNLWNYNFHKMNNPFIIDLSNGFNDVDNKLKTLEAIRDDVRRKLHIFSPQTMAFGNFTSIENIFAAILETTYQVQSVQYTCCNGHVRRMNDSHSLVLLNGTGHYNSIQEWASRGQEETRHTCSICDEPVFIKYGFNNMPSLFVFEFSNQELHINSFINIQIQNDENRLRLAGVIYYGQHHFTAQIILSDGQVWFYDGIDTGRNLIYNGSINSNLPSISHCREKQAVAAIYVCV